MGIRDRVVAEALVRGKAQVLLMQWSGATRQAVSIPWVEIDDFSAVERLADRIERVDRPWRNYSTAIGEALQQAVKQFDAVPGCKRRVIDLSGDGTSNEGLLPGEMGDALVQARVMGHALASEQSQPELTGYF